MKVFYEDVLTLRGMSDDQTKQPSQSGWRFCIKKAFDRSAALYGLIVLSPVFIAASVLAH